MRKALYRNVKAAEQAAARARALSAKLVRDYGADRFHRLREAKETWRDPNIDDPIPWLEAVASETIFQIFDRWESASRRENIMRQAHTKCKRAYSHIDPEWARKLVNQDVVKNSYYETNTVEQRYELRVKHALTSAMLDSNFHHRVDVLESTEWGERSRYTPVCVYREGMHPAEPDGFPIEIQKTWLSQVFKSGIQRAAAKVGRILVTHAELSGEVTEDFGVVYDVKLATYVGKAYGKRKIRFKNNKAVRVEVNSKFFWGFGAKKHDAVRKAREAASASMLNRLAGSTEQGTNKVSMGFL